MHELSIAQNIADIVREHVPAGDLELVRTVRVRLGELSGVVAESLEFSYGAVVSDTPLEGSVLEFEHVPFALLCADCGRTSADPAGMMLCPVCRSGRTQVQGGLELHVADIGLEERKEETG